MYKFNDASTARHMLRMLEDAKDGILVLARSETGVTKFKLQTGKRSINIAAGSTGIVSYEQLAHDAMVEVTIVSACFVFIVYRKGRVNIMHLPIGG